MVSLARNLIVYVAANTTIQPVLLAGACSNQDSIDTLVESLVG